MLFDQPIQRRHDPALLPALDRPVSFDTDEPGLTRSRVDPLDQPDLFHGCFKLSEVFDRLECEFVAVVPIEGQVGNASSKSRRDSREKSVGISFELSEQKWPPKAANPDPKWLL